MPPLNVPTQTLSPTDQAGGVSTGQLDGTFAVTPDGAAVFNVPLWVPPGRAGMQPDLSLQYSKDRSGL